MVKWCRSMITSSSAPGRRAACSPTGSPPTRQCGCCCSKRVARTVISGCGCPVGYFKTIFDSRFARLFDTEPSEGTAGRNVVWPRGRVLGGSSSINGLIYIRGQHADYDDWAALGATGWDYRSVLPFFRRSECYSGRFQRIPRRDGKLGVSDLRNDHPYCEAWVDGAAIRPAAQSGLQCAHRLRRRRLPAFDQGWLALERGSRIPASGAAAAQPDRGHRALATRVLFAAGRRASGVEWLLGERRAQAGAAREVVLAAGAIQSPQLLQLSGTGPSDLLRRHRIAVVARPRPAGARTCRITTRRARSPA